MNPGALLLGALKIEKVSLLLAFYHSIFCDKF
jgi:hypothetical protein